MWKIILFTLLVATSALAHDKGQYDSPDIAYWMNGLRQPNSEASCCGEADAYEADRQEECGPRDGNDCALVAIITDERDDARLRRAHIPVGTRVVIPPRKIRRPPSVNPTGHTIVFVHPSSLIVFCYEPLPLM